MTKVLFVCLGNICRSPTAEAVFRAKVQQLELDDDIHHDSCGTAGYHSGEPPDRRATQAAQKRGYIMTDLRARQVKDSDFHEFDYVLAMDRSNYSDLVRRCPDKLQHKVQMFLSFGGSEVQEVPDPYYGGPEGFNYVLDLVEDACDGLLNQIKKELAGK